MAYFVKAVGILFVALGVSVFIRPILVKPMIDFARVGKRCLFGGALRVAMGGLLLLSIPHVAVPLIPGTIGGLIAASGIAIFLLGIVRMHKLMDWMYMKSESMHRVPGCIIAILGILLIYSA